MLSRKFGGSSDKVKNTSNKTRDIIQGRSQNMRHLYPGMGLKLGVLRVFLKSKEPWFVRCVVTCIYCGLYVKINKCKTPFGMQRSWSVLHLFLRVWLAKLWRPPIWAPWLTTPIGHWGAVYKVWDLPCMSVNKTEVNLIWIILIKFNSQLT